MTYAPWMASIGPSEHCYYDAVIEMDSVEASMANVATYDDWFPDDADDGWISLGGYFDPQPAPDGFVVDVKRDPHMGVVTDYRFVRAV